MYQNNRRNTYYSRRSEDPYRRNDYGYYSSGGRQSRYHNNSYRRGRGFEEAERWDSGYDNHYATMEDESPTLSSRLAMLVSSIGGAIMTKGRKGHESKVPPVKTKNVMYDDCVKLEHYQKYLLKGEKSE